MGEQRGVKQGKQWQVRRGGEPREVRQEDGGERED